MSQFGVPFTLIGPDGSRAVFNDDTDPDYVGLLNSVSGLDSAEVRENFDDRVEADGGVHGNFWYGRRPVVLEGLIRHTTAADRNAKEQKLLRASNAMRGDAGLSWTPDGSSIARRILLRRQQPVRISGAWNKQFMVPLVAENAAIESNQQAGIAVLPGGVTSLNAPLLRAPLTKSAGFTDTASSPATLTAQGGILPGRVLGPTGEVGGATFFDGTDDYITSNYAGFPNGGVRAYSAFVRRRTRLTDDVVFGSSGTPYTLAQFEDGTDTYRFYINGSSYDVANAIPMGQWVHMLLYFNEVGNLLLGYVNGRLALSVAVADQNNAAAGNLQIGAYSANGNPFDGNIANFAVHSTLTLAEIRALAHIGPTANPNTNHTGHPTTLVNLGDEPVPLTIRLHNTVTASGGAVTVANQTTNQSIRYTASITAAGFLELDTRNRTARFHADQAGGGVVVTNVAGSIDFTNTTWFWLQPGANQITIIGTFSGGGAGASYSWRHGWGGV